LAANRIKVDPQEVIHETVDGEVILIALQTGCYYSLEGSAAEIWGGLVGGRTCSEVVGELERRYAAAPGAIQTAVTELVERLVDERLAVPQGHDGAPLAVVPSQQPDADPVPFPPPVVHKFTDMQDFLLVDPIHEVGDEGWPHAQAAP
jgi:hypothetical protein